MSITLYARARNLLIASCCILLLFGLNSCQKKNDPPGNRATDILPAPQNIQPKKGVSIKPQKIKTIYLYARAGKDDQFTAHLLQDKIDSLYGYKPDVQVAGSYQDLSKPAIVLGLPSADSEFANFSSGLPVPKKDTGESYVLDVKNNVITISGSDNAGLFYGTQTLNQLLEDAQWSGEPLQGVLIQDWPDLKLRAVHFDEKHHLDRYGYLKQVIRKLAKYKVNEVVFEFEDKFGYQTHPDIPAPNSFSPEQIKELTRYARQYHITITPLVQGLGHAGYILKHDKYKPLREDPESNWAFNPLKEGTYDLLFDLYGEAIAATPGSKYFQVGGDEVRFSGTNQQMQAYETKHGELSLYLTWLNKVHDYLGKQGRTMRFWDDVPLKKAGLWKLMRENDIPDQKADSIWNHGITRLNRVIKKFPRDAVFTQWTYTQATEGNARLIDWFKKHDLQTISATATQNTRPLIPDYDKKPANIKSFISLSAKKHVLGELCTAWDNSGPHFETYWMGFLASAEYGWSAKSPTTIRQYWTKYLHRFFGEPATGLYQAFHNLSKRVDFWNTALLKKGTKYSFNDNKSHLITLPLFRNWQKQKKDHWSSLVKKAKEEQKKNAQAVKILERNMNQVKQNIYNLKVFASMGRFMKAHAELVGSIGKIARYRDKALAAEKKHKKKQVQTYLNKMATTADDAWTRYKESYKNLKKVWEVSRYPKGGKGYVPNRYGQLASKREDLSYLIMAEEALDLPGYARNLREEANKYKK